MTLGLIIHSKVTSLVHTVIVSGSNFFSLLGASVPSNRIHSSGKCFLRFYCCLCSSYPGNTNCSVSCWEEPQKSVVFYSPRNCTVELTFSLPIFFWAMSFRFSAKNGMSRCFQTARLFSNQCCSALSLMPLCNYKSTWVCAFGDDPRQ